MSLGKRITLSNGLTIPQIGLGTWQSKPKEVEHAVEYAVKHGYRHLDLAMIYENQDEVGAALKNLIPSVVKREDLFITSKVWNSSHQPSEVEKELNETLKQLGTDYLDLYLIHWPVGFAPSQPGKNFYPPHPSKKGEVDLDTETSLVETWKAMIALPKSKVRSIGVSNFSIDAIQGLIDATGVVPIANQIEAHPYLKQDKLREFCKAKNIHITAYSPLGNNGAGLPKLTDSEDVIKIAEELGATPAQVLIAWGTHRGYSVIPKSVQKERIESNFTQIELTEEQYERVSQVGGGKYHRFNIPFNYNPKWDVNIFNEPAEKNATYGIKIV